MSLACVGTDESYAVCCVNIDAQSKYNLHTIPQNLLKHMHTHTLVPPSLEKVFCCFFFLFFPPLSPSVRMTVLNAFLHILAYMKNGAFQGKCDMFL